MFVIIHVRLITNIPLTVKMLGMCMERTNDTNYRVSALLKNINDSKNGRTQLAIKHLNRPNLSFKKILHRF